MSNLSRPSDDKEELVKIFPADDDARFRMNYYKVPHPEDFLAPTVHRKLLLQQRADILEAHPERHAALLPEGEEHFDHLAVYMAEHGAIDADTLAAVRTQEDVQRRCIELGKKIEPDVAIIRKGINRSLRLVGGCVCFPSSWYPEKKMGMELADIHAVVPGLNAQLGQKITAMLSNMQPGSVGMRADWSVKSQTELNHHPLQHLSLPDASATLEQSYIRVERQMMVGLPEATDGAGGIAFFIRIALYRALDLVQDVELRAGFLRTLKTMPEDVAAYKGLSKRTVPWFKSLNACSRAAARGKNPTSNCL